MKKTRVLSLIREDPTCHKANKPVGHNYWACALEPNQQLPSPCILEPLLQNKRSHCKCMATTEKPPLATTREKPVQQQRPSSVCVCARVCAHTHTHLCKCMLVSQLCLTLCNPIKYSSPGSSVHGILQARILEWVAMPFSRWSSQPSDAATKTQHSQK